VVELGHKWEERRKGGREEGREGGHSPTCVPRGLVDHPHVAAFVGGLELPGAVQELALEFEGLSKGVGWVGKKEEEEEDDGGEGKEEGQRCHARWLGVGGECAKLASSSWSSSSRSGQRDGGRGAYGASVVCVSCQCRRPVAVFGKREREKMRQRI